MTEKSENIKQVCDSLNLKPLINCATRINPLQPGKDILIDVILTNAAHKYVAVGVFSNDMSDHCAIACVRSTKLPKLEGQIVLRRSFRHFSEQAFLQDLSRVKWLQIELIPTIEDAVAFFKQHFLTPANKHAPLGSLG